MKKLPADVQEYVDVLAKYADAPSLSSFDILHLYPKEIAAPNGYFDSRFFELVGFNIVTMQKRSLGRHDSVDFDGDVGLQMVRIFADGSTLVKFRSPVAAIGNTQAITMMSSTRKPRVATRSYKSAERRVEGKEPGDV
jgi:hypothetical protein